jgi:hypothetical protein
LQADPRAHRRFPPFIYSCLFSVFLSFILSFSVFRFLRSHSVTTSEEKRVHKVDSGTRAEQTKDPTHASDFSLNDKMFL